MSRKLLKEWLPSRHTAAQIEWLQSFKHLFDRPELWHLTRYSVAKAVAIGMFSAFLPIPMQMLVSGTVAIFFRANLFIAVGMVWLTNPLTITPIYYFCYRVGLRVLALPPVQYVQEWSFLDVIHGMGHIWQPLFTGLAVVGLTCTVVSYYAVLLFWRISVSLSWRARKRKKK